MIRAKVIFLCVVFVVSCQQRRDRTRGVEHRDTSAPSEADSLSTVIQVPPAELEERRGIHELEWQKHRAEALLDDESITEFQMAIEAGSLGEWDKAREIFEEIIHSHPDNHRAHFNLGLCHKYLRNYTAAREFFRRAYELQPDSLYKAELKTVESWIEEQ